MVFDGVIESQKIMLYTIFVWFSGLIVFFIGSTAAIFFYPFDLWENRSGDLIHIVSRYFARTLLWICRIKVEVKGLENLYTDRAQLICANHQSLFDILILDSILPLQFRFIVKKELYAIPILGLCLKIEHHVLLDRENRRKGIESIKRAGDLISRGRSVVVFPEGTRSTDGQIKKFRKGSMLIVSNTKAPVVPLTINGSFRIMSKKSFRLHPGNVKIVISPPIKTEDLTRSEQKELSEKVRQIIIEGIVQ